MPKWQPEASLFSMWRVLAWAALLTFCIFSGLKYAENLVHVQAWGGWSPMDWAAHQLFPDNFKTDFPSGISAYRMSSIMQLYSFLAGHGADLERFVPWVVRFEVVFLGVSTAVFFRTLAPQSSYVAMAIFAVLVVEGSVRDMNLARFGGALYQGLFYNIEDALRLLGLAALFRKRILMAALLLGMGFTVHPVMAGMACIFAAPYVVLNFGRFSYRRWLVAGALFLAVSGAWILVNIQSAEVASGGIPSDQWMGFVRMFTYHWFPVDIGLFTSLHERYILPLLCLVLLAVLYLPRVIHARAKRVGIAWGMGLLVGLACAGVLISEFSSEPFLIKLALHRSCDLLILVSLLIVVAGLTDEVLSGRVLESGLGGALLLSPLVSGPAAFPVSATMALLAIHCVRARVAGENARFMVTVSALVVFFIVVSLYYLMGTPNTSAYLGANTLGYFGLPVFWIVFVAFVCGGALRWILHKAKLQPLFASSFLSLALLGVVLYFSVVSVDRKSLMSDERKVLASDYLAVQRWARANTEPDSLFMVDPTIYYGWRDFSQRSSFGNLREWLHTSWLYDSRADVYAEGIKRFGEFEIDIEPYKRIRPSIDGYHRLSDDLRQIFYLKDEAWFEDLSRRYGIEYIVFQKKFATSDLRFGKAFENDSFVVYRLAE